MKRSSGFTLIELLVVVSIIALLISILLPSLGKAKERARSVRCMANLHALGITTHIYQRENDDSFPVRALAVSPNDPAPLTLADLPTCHASVFRFTGQSADTTAFPSSPYTYEGNFRGLNNYMSPSNSRTSAVWICPSDPGFYKFTGSSYGMNLFTSYPSLAIDNTRSVKGVNAYRPDMVLAAEHGGNQAALGQVMGEIDDFGGNAVQVLPPAGMFWHTTSQRWNVLFVDGHAETVQIVPNALTASGYTYKRE